jgi:hypothetical protein
VRIVVTGGREYDDLAAIDRALTVVHRKHGIDVLIQGGARGADRFCGDWATAHGIPVEGYPADWETHGKKAGVLRNQQMIDEGKPDAAVAFPGGRGTADMVARLERSGIPTWKPAQGMETA